MVLSGIAEQPRSKSDWPWLSFVGTQSQASSHSSIILARAEPSCPVRSMKEMFSWRQPWEGASVLQKDEEKCSSTWGGNCV